MVEFPRYAHLGDKYEHLAIKDYRYWRLYVHPRQYPYLGRCYAATLLPPEDFGVEEFKRNEDYFDKLPREASIEFLEEIVPEWKNALKVFYQNTPFKTNIACLTNEWPVPHIHFIPRFENPVFFDRYIFKDPNPYGNYSPYPKMELPEDVVKDIRDALHAMIMRVTK